MQPVPRISIVIPTYNRAGTIERALDSVFAQTFQDFEVIVVDDGSRDATRERVAPYADRVRYIYQENQGCSAARNRGIAEAQGEFVAFLDSDDEWLPPKLEVQVRYLETHPEVDFVACMGTEAGTRFDPADYAEPSQQFLQSLLVPFPPNMTRYLVRRSCFARFGTLNPALRGAEDWELWLRLLKNGCQFAICPEALTVYHWSDDALSLNVEVMLNGEQHVKRLYVDTLPNWPQRVWIRSLFLARCYYSAAVTLRENGRKGPSFVYMVRSLLCNPLWPRSAKRVRFLLSLAVRQVVKRRAAGEPLLVEPQGPTGQRTREPLDRAASVDDRRAVHHDVVHSD